MTKLMKPIVFFKGKKGFEVSRVVTLTKKQENILKAVDKKMLAECSG